MVDIHSHILWGLDDGAETMDESVAMLKMAADAGTTDIVASPHANFRYRYEPAIVTQRIADLSAAAGGKPRIHRGCDFHLSFDNVEAALVDPRPYTINGAHYLLVEFPDASVAGMGRILGMLLDRGLIPIMTHPERNAQLRGIPDEFVEWIEKGCLVQVTGQSLLGRFGKSAEESGWQMIRRGYVHFVASDAHDTKDRTPRLDAAYEAVAKRMDEKQARRLFFENPRAVLTGDSVETASPKRKSWLQWWN
jgi:protein-tyrosine phosphatase